MLKRITIYSKLIFQIWQIQFNLYSTFNLRTSFLLAYTFISCNNKQVRLPTGFSEPGISCVVNTLPAMLFTELNCGCQ